MFGDAIVKNWLCEDSIIKFSPSVVLGQESPPEIVEKLVNMSTAMQGVS
jgi:hypothetical protein